MESLFPYIFLTGLTLIIIGALILLVAAFRTRIWWGLGILVFPPVAIAFFAKHSRRSRIPSIVMCIGGLMAAGPPIYLKLTPVDLGPRAPIVNGELHVTLTGWDQKDYSVLRHYSSAVILQMANSDVTDATLFKLKGLNRLRELDLNGSQVTDFGLKTLVQELPALETLKLSRTAVTDAGMTESIGRMESRKRLDLRGTKVSTEVVKAWREANPLRRVLQ